MKKGGGKGKGSKFERQICKELSLWVSNGKSTDVFWRSAMSGGRATIHARKGTKIRQAGDICAVAPEGHALTNFWFIECKNIKDMNLAAFLISNKGPLAKFWNKVQQQAEQHSRNPMLIVRSRGPILVFTRAPDFEAANIITADARACVVTLFSDILKYRW